MAKEAKEATEGKKGGKLPIIIIVVVALLGGGFFGMKMAGGKKSEVKKQETKLGKIAMLPEFLTNAKGGNFIKAEIGLHLKEGFEAKALEEYKAPIRSVILTVFASHTSDELMSLEGQNVVKRDMAARINKVLEEFESLHPKKEGGEAKEEPKDKKVKGKKDTEEEAENEQSGVTEHPEWDSDEGPVLRIYFTNLATQ